MNNENVDRQDVLILRSLMDNARASLREVASQTGMAVGTVQNRLSKLKQRGVLKDFRPIVDYSKLGYGVDAIIALNIRRDKQDEIRKLLHACPNVMSIYETTGEVDVFLRCVFKSPEDLHDFLMNHLSDELVKKSVTHMVMKNERKDVLLDHI